MLSGILGRKIGMTHIWDEEGRMVPVTVILAGPVYVTQVKRPETDGYSAVQVGFEEVKPAKLNFPESGHLMKAGVPPLRHLREFKVLEGSVEVGQRITVDIFKPGERVKVVGTSKGRGFTGAMKRHGFRGQHDSHGYMTHRRPLSSGATGPARVLKGKRGPGRMGGVRTTQKNLLVVQVDGERNLLLVRGAVPGANGGLVMVVKEGK
ncbi:MAG: 50S ribosomal protein L3 [Fimbriimonadales bacterium]|jgi:large subunit ribosomal protein L3|nr:50S ribosomal protein L3 [Fimbriimonadales bacterium]